MPFTEDLSQFFNPAEFATAATVAGAAVNGIFDNAYIDPSGLGVGGTAPIFTCASANVAGVVKGSAAVINDISYTVQGIEPDGTGVTRLLLERV